MNNKQIVEIQELNRQANFIMNVQGLEEQRDENGLTINSFDTLQEIENVIFSNVSAGYFRLVSRNIKEIRDALDIALNNIQNEVKQKIKS